MDPQNRKLARFIDRSLKGMPLDPRHGRNRACILRPLDDEKRLDELIGMNAVLAHEGA